ncbi:hypothetical protein AGOR_G00120750 [Albula goreensis]|uniref:Uncharacterized protein n=1 Tax=Albula goreensis TaxID=1534307 RepID=A0A8T3DF43_9TELE|nr:hypothetical protein AGOR_G00120750 [Albula goreensis]
MSMRLDWEQTASSVLPGGRGWGGDLSSERGGAGERPGERGSSCAPHSPNHGAFSGVSRPSRLSATHVTPSTGGLIEGERSEIDQELETDVAVSVEEDHVTEPMTFHSECRILWRLRSEHCNGKAR